MKILFTTFSYKKIRMEDTNNAEENEIFEITDFTNATPWER